MPGRCLRFSGNVVPKSSRYVDKIFCNVGSVGTGFLALNVLVRQMRAMSGSGDKHFDCNAVKL
jgi:hypothetical protein